jgi:TonB family protein
VAVLLALLLHGAFVGFLALLSYVQLQLPSPPPPPKPPSAVALRPLTAQEWENNRGPPPKDSQAQASRPVEVKKKEKKPEEKPKGQVVDVAPGNNQEAPDAQYLAERNNKVDKETRAREQTPDYRNAMPQRTERKASVGAGAPQEEAPTVAGNNGLGEDDRPLRQGGQRPVFELPDARRKQEVALDMKSDTTGPGMEVSNRNESEEVAGNSKRLRIQPGQGEGDDAGSMGRAGSPGLARLMPSQAVMDQIIGAAPNDHLRNMEEGEGTFLNTREWKYAGFFNRVKQSVGTHWRPGLALNRRDPTGNIYSGRDRHTVLEVTLDARGQVADITVLKSCGLDFLDLEAIESFKRAEPFPNPPAGLLEHDSKVRFTFGFFMEMGGGPKLRLFRQPN